MKNILVLGANGFLGSHFCKILNKRNYKIFPVVRYSSNLKRFRKLNKKGNITILKYKDISDTHRIIKFINKYQNEVKSMVFNGLIDTSKNHNNNVKLAIKNYLKNKFPNSKVYINIFDSEKTFYLKDITEINKIYSTPILSLLTLTNSESHNFTAESLFKNASNTWNDNEYIKLKRWLENKGLPITNAYFADASGLSRKNKITTKLVVLFLDKMRYFNDFIAYQSTLSITGVRGTLAKRFVNSELSGKFFGKTGTLSNVFALSGFLYKNDDPIIISIIQNSNKIDKEKAFKLLRDLYYLKSC